MSDPDIQTGGLPSWAITMLVSLLLVGGVGAAVVLQKEPGTTQKIDKSSSLFSKGFPSDFFGAGQDEAEEIPDKEATAKAAAAAAAAVTPKPRIVYRSRPIAKAPPSPPIDYAAIAEKQRAFKIEQINKKRRGSGVAFSAIGGRFGEETKTEWVNTEENYQDQGLAGIEASFPVNLERTITADRFISATLINNIHSQMGGKIVAQIDMNIYGAHGRKVLIPAASKAIGRYFPTGKVGDSRIKAIWTRIITPKGINIVLGNAEMADAWGRAGISGDVDSRVWERYGVALLISSISAAGQMTVPVNQANTKAGVDALSREFSRTTQAILDQNIDLKPIIKIDAGTRIFITPLEDIWFKKPIKRTVLVQRSKESNQ